MDESSSLRLAPPTFHGRRAEVKKIVDMAVNPHPHHVSSVLLIEGPGGMGKSMLIRQAIDVLKRNYPELLVVGPLDMDDTNYHIPTNVGLEIAHSLGDEHFTRYIEANRKYQGRELQAVDRSTIHIHLALGDRYFVEDYSRFAHQHRVAIFADTVETIRGTHIWSYFTRMIALLPNTVFVLAGRHSSPFGLEKTPFIQEKVRFEKMPNIGEGGAQVIQLRGWSNAEARNFIEETCADRALADNDIEKLLHLSRCQPLHLTLALQHLRRLPTLDTPLEEIIETAPLHKYETNNTTIDETVPPDVGFEDLSDDGKSLVTRFNRELLLHLADTSPLAQTMSRIGHLRRRINEKMYGQIVAFPPAIKDAPDWEELIKQPWVRHRTDGYITWHDIVGELLREHVWPIRDPLGEKRQNLSQRVIKLYDELISEFGEKIEELNSRYDSKLNEINRQGSIDLVLEDDFPVLVSMSNKLVELRRRLWPINAEKLYYELDANIQSGYLSFVKMYSEADKSGQLTVRELLLSEMENFLGAFKPGSDEYYEIVLRQIDVAISDNLQQSAVEKVEHLCSLYANPQHQYQMLIRQGNSFLRMFGREKDGLSAFEQAKELAEHQSDPSMVGEAFSEIGFAYRQLGRWDKAAEMYRHALRKTPLSNRDLRAEISIQLAYVQALVGEYDAANKFIENSLVYLRRQGGKVLFGAGLSVQGEVYRYQKKYVQADTAYDEALALFRDIENQGWLGVVQQEKAICLIQEENPKRDIEQALYYIEQALYLCRERNTREYPSALNRAGRIYQQAGQYDKAFAAFTEGIEVAQAAQNVWFLIANVIEYAELAVQLWHDTDISKYEEMILDHEELVNEYAKSKEYTFADLFGRWHLVKGHKVWLAGQQAHKSARLEDAERQWQVALEEYALGFSMIAQGYYGSHGIGALPREGKRLQRHIMELPTIEGKRWCEYFHEQWSSLDDPAILQGIVEEIYGGVLQKEEQSQRQQQAQNQMNEVSA